MNDAWDELVSAALMGTHRRPYQGELLESAAVHVVRRRAGRLVSEAEAAGGAAAGEEAEAVSRAAGERLARILGGEQPRLLPEWLQAAAKTGRRVPPHLVPDLLDQGARDRSIRAHLGVLAGHRGRWLAGLNPGWAYLLAEPTGETWELGSAGDRRAYLRELRAADPAKARGLLEGGWEKETPDDRAEFLALLAEGLSMDDEPFLEAALDDRRREVRQHAADLLTRLPDSRLSHRMAERAAACLTVRARTIIAEPPRACDKEMERDGVRGKPPRGTGERAWWLQQIVARTPLAFWGGPAERLVRKRIPDWDREVKAGWVRAAVLQGDPGWARALFAWDPLADLLAALPPAEQEAVAADFVKRHGVDGQLIMVLGGVSVPWGADLALAVLKKILKVAGSQPWNLGELTRIAGECIDPALHAMAAALSPEPPVQEVAALLRFRSDMLKELT